MRLVPVVLVLLALPAVAPPALADERRGDAYGVNLGYYDAGLWSTWWFEKWGPAGPSEFILTWSDDGYPPSDYDLLVYAPGALDDMRLTEHPIASASTRSFTVREERIQMWLDPGEYVVAVVPHQAQGEDFVLGAHPGILTRNEGPTVGVRQICSIPFCR